jgi:hypothetical protein
MVGRGHQLPGNGKIIALGAMRRRGDGGPVAEDSRHTIF